MVYSIGGLMTNDMTMVLAIAPPEPTAVEETPDIASEATRVQIPNRVAPLPVLLTTLGTVATLEGDPMHVEISQGLSQAVIILTDCTTMERWVKRFGGEYVAHVDDALGTNGIALSGGGELWTVELRSAFCDPEAANL